MKVRVGTGTPQTLTEVPAAVSIITKEEIARTGATFLGDLLESVPGLHLHPVVGRSLDSAYSIRGLNTSGVQVLVLIDGTPIPQLLVGGPPIGFKLPVTSIERVEVVRGPGSAVFGADALAGVVNIVTKQGEEPGSRAGLGFGSFGKRRAWAEHAATRGDWKFYVAADWLRSDGDEDRIVAQDLQTAIDTVLGTSASKAPGPLATDYELADLHLSLTNSRWGFRLWGQDQTLGNGIGGSPALDPVGDFDSESLLVELNHRHETTNGWRFQETLHSFYLDGGGRYVLNPPGAVLPLGRDGNPDFANPVGAALFTEGLLGNPGVRQRSTGLDLTATYDLHPDRRWRFNGGAVRESVDTRETKNFGPGVLDPSQTVVDGTLTDVSGTPFVFLQDRSRTRWYLALQDQWRFHPKWELTTGIRYDHYSDFGDTFNPRLALVWTTRPDLVVKLLYGSAFHGPGFGQQFGINSPLLGNPDLKPEMVDIVEAVVDYRTSDAVRWVLSLFSYEARDLIELVPEGPNVSRTRNVRDQDGVGGEIEVQWDVSERLEVRSNVAWVDASRSGDAGDTVPEVADFQAFFEVDWQLNPDWNTGVRSYWISERKREGGDARPPTAGYTLVDAVLQTTAVLPGLDLTLAVRNLTDELAREPAGTQIPQDIPLPGRSFEVSLSYSL